MKLWEEHAEQVLFFDWIRRERVRDERYKQVYAIANGQLRSTAVGVRLKAEGVTKGVLDIAVDVPMGDYHGAKIEMKKPGLSPSREQQEFIERNDRFGYAVLVARSGAEAIVWLMQYMMEPYDKIARLAQQLGHKGSLPDVHGESDG